MTIATVLEAERMRLGLSQSELARRSQMSAGRIRGILVGEVPNPGIFTLAKVLVALGRNLAWLEKILLTQGDT